MRDFAESHAQISAESRNSEGSASRLLDGGWIAALLHSKGLRGGRLRSQIRERKTPVQRKFGIEPGGKCPKTECFAGKGTEALPQSFYCTFTAIRRKSLIMNGAGEGNRTLVTSLED